MHSSSYDSGYSTESYPCSIYSAPRSAPSSPSEEVSASGIIFSYDEPKMGNYESFKVSGDRNGQRSMTIHDVLPTWSGSTVPSKAALKLQRIRRPMNVSIRAEFTDQIRFSRPRYVYAALPRKLYS